ncbi:MULTISPECIES: APC family permease [Thermomonosporaceae]|uniref:APC family permease n=1 Tax=Thermomonosporaceae TaxID=2012 RepID=UPI00255A9195|nr:MULTISPECIES: APC family permease [Thermomonosporaceae]MDL4770974.1 APC family permease [Actinomadura xylanilytica]
MIIAWRTRRGARVVEGGTGDGAARPPARAAPRVPPHRGEGDRERLTAFGGLAALSLDAFSSVAYGPEAIVLVLVAAGAAALRFTLPVAAVIAVLLVVLVVSYRQVIAVHPDGGGSYAVARRDLGQPVSLLAAASLLVDYVLTVAVSLSAGAASIASAFPVLSGHLLEMALCGLLVIAGVNLWGIAESARVLMLPMAAFVVLILGIVAAGLVRGHPAAVVGGARPVHAVEAVGIVLILKAFSAGCSALTGVEAIANGTPAFQEPRVRRAQHTEIMLGVLLGAMLLGLATLITRDHVAPRAGVTVLAQLSAGAFGAGWLYYAVNLVTALILALAANTSFGGLPVLFSLLARDHRLPHLFALRSRRPVFRFGIVTLALFAAVLLIVVDAATARLIPLYAIGVFIGFTISQTGLVRHWWSTRPPRWAARAALNGAGAAMTATATAVFLASKFTEGAWVVVVIIPLVMLLFARIQAFYRAVDREIGADLVAAPARNPAEVVIVPVAGIDRLTGQALGAALTLGLEVIAVSVHTEADQAAAFRERWDRWDPGVRLETLTSPQRSLIRPIITFVREKHSDRPVAVLVPEVEPRRWRYRLLQDPRPAILVTLLRTELDVIVCTYPYRLTTR